MGLFGVRDALRIARDQGLDLVEIVMGVEEQLGIEIPDNAIEEFHTVGDVVRFVEDHT